MRFVYTHHQAAALLKGCKNIFVSPKIIQNENGFCVSGFGAGYGEFSGIVSNNKAKVHNKIFIAVVTTAYVKGNLSIAYQQGITHITLNNALQFEVGIPGNILTECNAVWVVKMIVDRLGLPLGQCVYACTQNHCRGEQ